MQSRIQLTFWVASVHCQLIFSFSPTYSCKFFSRGLLSVHSFPSLYSCLELTGPECKRFNSACPLVGLSTTCTRKLTSVHTSSFLDGLWFVLLLFQQVSSWLKLPSRIKVLHVWCFLELKQELFINILSLIVWTVIDVSHSSLCLYFSPKRLVYCCSLKMALCNQSSFFACRTILPPFLPCLSLLNSL